MSGKKSSCNILVMFFLAGYLCVVYVCFIIVTNLKHVVMKKSLLISFLFGLLCLNACEKKELFPEHDAVEAKFQLLNAAGNPATTFSEGEDIIFDYRILNKTGEDLNIYQSNHSTDIHAFPVFTVYDASSKREIGAVFKRGFVYFKTGYTDTLRSGEEIIIRATWLGNLDKTTVNWTSIEYLNNQLLPKGKYIVQFEHKLRFPGPYKDFHADISVPFEVR